MKAGEKKQKTMKIPIIISIILSISILLLILYFTIDSETLSHITSQKIKYEFFIAAIIVNFFYWVFWGARLKVLTNAIDKNVNRDDRRDD